MARSIRGGIKYARVTGEFSLKMLSSVVSPVACCYSSQPWVWFSWSRTISLVFENALPVQSRCLFRSEASLFFSSVCCQRYTTDSGQRRLQHGRPETYCDGLPPGTLCSPSAAEQHHLMQYITVFTTAVCLTACSVWNRESSFYSGFYMARQSG